MKQKTKSNEEMVEEWKERPLFKAMNDQQKRTSVGWLLKTLEAKDQLLAEREGEVREEIRNNLNQLLKSNDYYGGSPVLGPDDIEKALSTNTPKT